MSSSPTIDNPRLTRAEVLKGIERLAPWFHCIDLGDGLLTKSKSAIGEPIDHPRPTWENVKAFLPPDLTGQTLLDVGCNAGFYSIEAKRRGAARVLGLDSQRDLIKQAEFVREVLELDIEYGRKSVYDLDPFTMGQFDVTLALGLIYHCKHLVLALEKLFLITRRLLILETAIYPPEKTPDSFEYEEGGERPTLHPLAYVENRPEAKEAVYNWFLPSTAALTALLRNVGFDEIEVRPTPDSDRAVIACGKQAPFPDSRSISYLAATLSLIAGPSRCGPNEELIFRVRAHNTGYARWLRGSKSGTEIGDVHLVTHVLNANESPVAWYHAGAFLPDDVEPNESVELEIAMRAPESPGKYVLQFDMVSEHLAWFEDLGSEVLMHQLMID
jgi:tRNA (mo5U34)-methyltransferase